MGDPEWDAVDGGTTASVMALIDGERIVYAAVGDSAGLIAVRAGGGAPHLTELVAEHSPTRLDEYTARLARGGGMVVYSCHDPDDMHLYPVFRPDCKGGFELDPESIARCDAEGLGFKTERGDRAAIVATPESGEYTQMMLNMTRSVGDFYHQRYGVTWEPEVVCYYNRTLIS